MSVLLYGNPKNSNPIEYIYFKETTSTMFKHLLHYIYILPFILLSMQAFSQSADSQDYTPQWQQIDSLEKEGLTRSALEKANEIFESTQSEAFSLDYVKAVIYKLKYTAQIEEKSEALAETMLREALYQAQAPVKQLLHSYLAQFYWQHFQYNRWKIYDRTPLGVMEQDFQTWDAQRYHREISYHFLASLSATDTLQQMSSDEFEMLLINGDTTRQYRPTIYDILAHEALNYFANDESLITEPVEEFRLSTEELFVDAAQFVQIPIAKTDTLSHRYLTIKLYQDLLEFHLQRSASSVYALVDIDLERLNYLYNQATEENKSAQYERCLKSLSKQYNSHPIVGEVDYRLAQLYYQQARLYDPFVGEAYRWDSKKAWEICKHVVETFSETRGAILCQNLINSIESKSIQVEVEDVNLPGSPFLGKLTFRNVDSVFFRLIEAPNREERDYDRKRLVEFFKAQKPVKNWSITLPALADYQQHSTEFKIDGVAPGSYVLLVSDNPDFSYQGDAVAYVWTQVSQISYFCRVNPGTGQLDIYVQDRETGEPLEGVDIQAYEWSYDDNQYNRFGNKLVTNESGYAYLKSPDDYHTIEFEFTHRKDTYRSGSLYAYRYQYGEQNVVQNVAHLFTDRKIYRPGQTIYFKAIVLEREGFDHKIKPEHPIKVALWDANREKVSELTLTTNDYGTISGSFQAPAGGMLGNMSLKTDGGATSFSVEEYKRPTFEVRMDSLQKQYQLGDTTQIAGMAKTYAGIPVSDAKVVYRVVRSAQFPYWRGFFGLRPFPVSEEKEIVQGVSKTDNDGKYLITFPLTADTSIPRESNPFFSYQIYVDVVDITGETQSEHVSLTAGYVPLLVDMTIPDRISSTNPGDIILSCTDLGNTPEPIKGTLTIYPLDEPDQLYRKRRWKQPDIRLIDEKEFKSDFSHIPYTHEDDFQTWESELPVATYEFDARQSHTLSLEKIKGVEGGKYVAEFIAMSGEIKVRSYFTVTDEDGKEPAFPMQLSEYVNLTQAQPGDKLQYELTTSEKKLWVLYELEHQGEILAQDYVRLKRNKSHKINIPIQESHRGNITVSASYVWQNQFTQEAHTIQIPWSNKELSLEWSTFRSELQPGDSDQWKLKIQGPQNESITAEMVATLYDASLDAFRSNAWDLSIYPSFFRRLNWNGSNGFGTQYAQLLAYDWNPTDKRIAPRRYDQLNGFGFLNGGYVNMYARADRRSGIEMQAVTTGVAFESTDAAPSPLMERNRVESNRDGNGRYDDTYFKSDRKDRYSGENVEQDTAGNFDQVEIRSDFNETAFFYPHLTTDDSGSVVIQFDIPEALTKWKFLGLAHTKDLKIGAITDEVVTRKKLMVKSHLPRFMREGDEVTLSAKVSNTTEKELMGSAQLKLLDANTMEPIDGKFEFYEANKTFYIPSGKNENLTWKLLVPEGVQAVVTQVIAQADGFSDGEEHLIPIFKNRMLVTETLPLAVRGESEQKFTFDKLLAADSSETLRHERLTLEFTSNPVWYAVQALPYLMEFPHECTEQIFSRYYANALASYVANSDPAIKRIFDRWKSLDLEKGSLVSNLEKNEELKSLLISETPWLLQATSETERKKRLGVLFDLNRMRSELQRSWRQLQERQYANGAFAWFAGMPPSRYITQHIATGMGHLQKWGAEDMSGNAELNSMMSHAVRYLDEALLEDYQLLQTYGTSLEKDHLSPIQVQYLYMRSFYIDVPIAKGTQAAYDYYYNQAKNYWVEKSPYMQGMIALATYRNGDEDFSEKVLKSLEENAVRSDELGMYWKQHQRGYYWYQNDIEQQALLIETFEDIGGYADEVEEMKIWLLKHKQTNDWETTRATVAACNALIQSGINLLGQEPQVTIAIGEQTIEPENEESEAGTGYIKKQWDHTSIQPEMGEVSVSKPTPGIAWGALYWQYFEQLDKITFAETPLSIQKALFIERNSDKGPQLIPTTDSTKLQLGDKVIVRVEIRVDRPMEYVHMKDMRAAGFEPINVLSQYKIRGGLGYYESTRDAATDFFFEFLPEGTHVFEYPLRVAHSGDYSNGVTTIQCMYAPEFTSHSEGIRVEIESE